MRTAGFIFFYFFFFCNFLFLLTHAPACDLFNNNNSIIIVVVVVVAFKRSWNRRRPGGTVVNFIIGRSYWDQLLLICIYVHYTNTYYTCNICTHIYLYGKYSFRLWFSSAAVVVLSRCRRCRRTCLTIGRGKLSQTPRPACDNRGAVTVPVLAAVRPTTTTRTSYHPNFGSDRIPKVPPIC